MRPLFLKTGLELHFVAAQIDTGYDLLGLAQILTYCTFLHHCLANADV